MRTIKSKYATLCFNDAENLDEGAMWPTSFALEELTFKEESRIVALLKKPCVKDRALESSGTWLQWLDGFAQVPNRTEPTGQAGAAGVKSPPQWVLAQA